MSSNLLQVVARTLVQAGGVVAIVSVCNLHDGFISSAQLEQFESKVDPLLKHLNVVGAEYRSTLVSLQQLYFGNINIIMTENSPKKIAHQHPRIVQKKDMIELVESLLGDGNGSAAGGNDNSDGTNVSLNNTSWVSLIPDDAKQMQKAARLVGALASRTQFKSIDISFPIDRNDKSNKLVKVLDAVAMRESKMQSVENHLMEQISQIESEIEARYFERKKPLEQLNDDFFAKSVAATASLLYIEMLRKYWPMIVDAHASKIPRFSKHPVMNIIFCIMLPGISFKVYQHMQYRLIEKPTPPTLLSAPTATDKKATDVNYYYPGDQVECSGQMTILRHLGLPTYSYNYMQRFRDHPLIKETVARNQALIEANGGRGVPPEVKDLVRKPKLRLGSTRDDSFNTERLTASLLFAPCFQEFLFTFLNLRAFMMYLHPVAAHLVTMVLAALVQDTNDDPALMSPSHELTHFNSFLLTCFRNLMSQINYQFTGFLPASILFHSSVKWHALLQQYAEDRYTVKEMLPLFTVFLNIHSIFSSLCEKEIFQLLLKSRAETSPSLSSSSSSSATIPVTPPSNPPSPYPFEDSKTCDAIMRIFSSDHFVDREKQKLNAMNTADLVHAFYHAVSKLELDTDNIEAFGSVLSTDIVELLLNECKDAYEFDRKLNHIIDTFQERIKKYVPSKGRSLSGYSIATAVTTNSADENSSTSQSSNTGTSTGAGIDSSTDHRAKDCSLSKFFIFHSLVLQIRQLFPDGVSREHVPLLLKRLMMNVPMEYWPRIERELSKWESNGSEDTEEFMELTQDFYTKLIEIENRAIVDTKKFFKDKYYVDLYVANLNPVERQAVNNRVAKHHAALKWRYMLEFWLERGLTPERFGALLEKYAANSEEAKLLKNEWKEYLTSPEYKKKLQELFRSS